MVSNNAKLVKNRAAAQFRHRNHKFKSRLFRLMELQLTDEKLHTSRRVSKFLIPIPPSTHITLFASNLMIIIKYYRLFSSTARHESC